MTNDLVKIIKKLVLIISYYARSSSILSIKLMSKKKMDIVVDTSLIFVKRGFFLKPQQRDNKTNLRINMIMKQHNY